MAPKKTPKAKTDHYVSTLTGLETLKTDLEAVKTDLPTVTWSAEDMEIIQTSINKTNAEFANKKMRRSEIYVLFQKNLKEVVDQKQPTDVGLVLELLITLFLGKDEPPPPGAEPPPPHVTPPDATPPDATEVSNLQQQLADCQAALVACQAALLACQAELAACNGELGPLKSAATLHVGENVKALEEANAALEVQKKTNAALRTKYKTLLETGMLLRKARVTTNKRQRKNVSSCQSQSLPEVISALVGDKSALMASLTGETIGQGAPPETPEVSPLHGHAPNPPGGVPGMGDMEMEEAEDDEPGDVPPVGTPVGDVDVPPVAVASYPDGAGINWRGQKKISRPIVPCVRPSLFSFY
jgi:hypothetical protein